MNRQSSPKRENPSELQLEGVSEGIEALPKRIERYGKAKKGALDVADYMVGIPAHQAMGEKVKGCGDYLVFRHYFTVDQVKLHGASLCRKHLLCPLCAIRRGAKSLAAYLQRWEVIKAEKPALNAYLVTLTVKDGDDLKERFNHLHKAQRELWMRKHRGRVASPLAGVEGAVWSYEVKRGSGSKSWHPHLHMIALAESMPDQAALSAEWHNITGDSFIVDVRPISQEDPASGFVEVFKYAVKFSDQPPADTVHAWVTLAGKRLLASSGCFRGVQLPESLLDDSEGLDGLPYVALFYRYLPGGFSLTKRVHGVHLDKPKRPARPAKPFDEKLLADTLTMERLTQELHEKREGEKQRLARIYERVCTPKEYKTNVSRETL
jgi:hypothetical protein